MHPLSPNPKASPALVLLLQDIVSSLRSQKVSIPEFQDRIKARVGRFTPAISSIRQNLRYTSKDFRRPSPHNLEAYYAVACGRELTSQELEQALITNSQ